MKIALASVLAAFAVGLAAQSHASTVLYTQNFESPNGFVNDSADVNAFRTINQLYSGQPAGFTFAQTNTVETLLVGGTQAFGVGFQDPQGIAGQYVLGMLSALQDDFLGLAFNVGASRFLNFQLDISSIDLSTFGGPFVPDGGIAPVFRLTLFDNPSGAVGVGSGTVLDSVDITGLVAPNKWTFNWRNVTSGLDAAGTTNGNVILRIDLLVGGYAAMDNFRIVASDIQGDVGGIAPVPEPETYALMLAGLALLGVFARRKRA